MPQSVRAGYGGTDRGIEEASQPQAPIHLYGFCLGFVPLAATARLSSSDSATMQLEAIRRMDVLRSQ